MAIRWRLVQAVKQVQRPVLMANSLMLIHLVQVQFMCLFGTMGSGNSKPMLKPVTQLSVIPLERLLASVQMAALWQLELILRTVQQLVSMVIRVTTRSKELGLFMCLFEVVGFGNNCPMSKLATLKTTFFLVAIVLVMQSV